LILRNLDTTHKKEKEVETSEMQTEAEKETKGQNKEEEEGEHNAPVAELRVGTTFKCFEN